MATLINYFHRNPHFHLVMTSNGPTLLDTMLSLQLL